MAIKEFLSPDDVLLDVRTTDKIALLHDLAKRAAATLGIDVAAVSAALIKREELGSTGMGAGVALPHARLAEISVPFGVLARLRKKIDFAAIDGAPVDLVFLLLLPSTPEGDQLNALAAVARKLRNAQVAAELRHARDAREMYGAFAG